MHNLCFFLVRRINPKDNEILKEILGEFVLGIGGYWLDSCMEGSYIFANVPDFRPTRPMNLHGGDENASHSKPMNYFIKGPKR